jgi:transcriptional regulator with XRE-family HTH domain
MSVLVSPGPAGGTAADRMLRKGLCCPAVVSLRRPGGVNVIVLDRPSFLEGVSDDGAQPRRPVGDNEVSRPDVAGVGLKPSRCPGDPTGEEWGHVDYSPTVRGRRLIREIERLRHDSGLSMEAAAKQLGWSVSKLYRLENGRSKISTDDLADMLDLYGVRSPRREALIQLGRDARRRGWWTAYADIFTGSYIAMEAEASSIRVNAHMIPGLFQTPGYARAVITGTRPKISAEEAERRVAARTARQDALFSRPDPPEVHVILDEAVLHREVGGPAVMARQLAALSEAMTRPQIVLQVLPFTSGANAGMEGHFVILAFGTADDPPVAYVDGLMGDVYVEAGEEVDRFNLAWTHLVSQALEPAESVVFIHGLAQRSSNE